MLIHGDCLEELKDMPSASLDALITDPPAGISFMAKSWDKDKGGRDHWIAWMQSIMQECLRVLKPGAHGLVWALPRTSHWTATALENAGFEIRDSVVHIFGSGFPKSTDVSKQIDKMKGAEREVIGIKNKSDIRGSTINGQWQALHKPDKGRIDIEITKPSSTEAKQWEGWGTALKPAHENWILVRRPLGEKTVAKNVLTHGTGALNIDASRIGLDGSENLEARQKTTKLSKEKFFDPITREFEGQQTYNIQGRFPANLLLSHHPECKETCSEECAVKGLDDHSGILKSGQFHQKGLSSNTQQPNGWITGERTEKQWGASEGGASRFFFQCHPDCAVKGLDDHSGILKSGNLEPYQRSNRNGYSGLTQENSEFQKKGDTGGASRYFYCAKASRKDRGPNNVHPTVKSTKLMEYLIRLITPPNGKILDPFAGSGSTLVAAQRLGFDFVGIEQDDQYVNIASERLKDA